MNDGTTLSPEGLPYLESTIETLDGQKINFTFERDSEQENRGFVIDILKAWIDGRYVGYLKCEYVSGELFDSYYPSGIFNFEAMIQGRYLIPGNNDKADLRVASAETLERVADNMIRYHMADEGRPEFKNYEDFTKWLETNNKNRLFRQEEKQFAKFKKRIDSPFVYYVATHKSTYNGLDEENRGRGIGTALYKMASIEFDKIGMRLRASTLQEEAPKRIWDRFQRDGLAYREGEHVYLDAAKVIESLVPTNGFRP